MPLCFLSSDKGFIVSVTGIPCFQRQSAVRNVGVWMLLVSLQPSLLSCALLPSCLWPRSCTKGPSPRGVQPAIGLNSSERCSLFPRESSVQSCVHGPGGHPVARLNLKHRAGITQSYCTGDIHQLLTHRVCCVPALLRASWRAKAEQERDSCWTLGRLRGKQVFCNCSFDIS